MALALKRGTTKRCIAAATHLWIATAVPGAAQRADPDQALRAFDEGRTEEARVLLEGLFSTPFEATARLYLGRIHVDRGHLESAVRELEQAAELEPHDADVAYWLGNAYLQHIAAVNVLKKRGAAKQARTTLIRALYLDPNHVAARVDLAGYYLYAPGIAGGSDEKAFEQLEAIRLVDPVRGHLFAAEAHEEQGAWDKAQDALDEAMAAAPDDPRALLAAGLFSQRRSDWEAALALFERGAAQVTALEHRRSARACLYQIGRTHALSGAGHAKAVEAFEVFLETYPSYEDVLTPGAYWRLGLAHEAMGNLSAAREALMAALDIDPGHQQARKALEALGG